MPRKRHGAVHLTRREPAPTRPASARRPEIRQRVADSAHQLTYHGALAPASTLRSRIVPGPPPRPLRPRGFAATAGDPRYSWAELMKRVFGHDVLRRHHCDNPRQVIALITEASVIRRILVHLGLPADPPRLAPARSPPQLAFEA